MTIRFSGTEIKFIVQKNQTMKKLITALITLFFLFPLVAQEYPKDMFSTSQGDLTLTCIGHASLMFLWNDMIIYVDPVMREADFTQFPEADMVLITHQHGDHLDKKALHAVMKDSTTIILPETSYEKLGDFDIPFAEVVEEWEKLSFDELGCEAIPAYNIKHTRSNGNPYHPKGMGVGYVLTFGDFKVLIGGDTEDIPEYTKIARYNIDVAFLPMNVPYTMTPEMVVSATKMLRPKILYPYHYGNTNTDELLELMVEDRFVEIRVRSF